MTVSSVLITAPLTAPSFATLGRTVQFAAVAKDASGAVLSGAAITWSSSTAAVATVSSSGLVTAAGNGTTSITASSGGVVSTGVTVTVAQVANALVIAPASVAFGAIGSTRQLAATVQDSGGSAVSGAPAATWTRAGNGATASVSGSGLVTALAVGTSDTAVASASGLTAKAPISVTQVVASVTVSSTGIDSLKNTGSTKSYSAVAKDSNANVIGSATFNWTSSSPGVATVGASTGVATAVADGNTNITATASGVSGLRGLVVARYAKTFTISPSTSQSITTPAGTIVFTGTAQDSSTANLTITWTSSNTAVLTLSPASGTSPSQSTATAKSNGSANVTMAGGLQSTLVAVSVSGQPTAPSAIAVNVGDDFFQSVRNSSNPAVDTLASGGAVTWTWKGVVGHNVTSASVPSAFTASSTVSSGTFSVTFNTPGTYGYYCTIHGSPGGGMHGTVIVQ